MKRKTKHEPFVFEDAPRDRDLAPEGTYDPPHQITKEEGRKICMEARKELADMMRRTRGAKIDSKTRMAVYARLIKFHAGENMPLDEDKCNWSTVMNEDVKIRRPQRSFKFTSGMKVPRTIKIKSKEPT